MFNINNDFELTNNETMDLEVAKRLFAESENLKEKIVEEISNDLVQKISATLVKKLQEHPVNFIQYLAKFKDLQETIGNRYKNFKLTHGCYCEIINTTVAKLEKKSFTVAIHKFDQLNLKIDISGWG